MGCLNSQGQFSHWFGNIHLSGPCNRACYFCIGQHMMALDPYNNLNTYPLQNLHRFVLECRKHNITEINVTGSNTDPLMYAHMDKLRAYLDKYIPGLRFGLRTNGVLALKRPDVMKLFDKYSLSITSFDDALYAETMGMGKAPDVRAILKLMEKRPGKLNVVMTPQTVDSGDIFRTLDTARELGIPVVNLREPYGQPHIGDPLSGRAQQVENILGMPTYDWRGVRVTVWDVHYVAVESVNLYANGEVSTTYPVTKGHCPKTGQVKEKKFFPGGRIQEQWIKVRLPNRLVAA